jgi:hypothetical protein
VAILKKIAIAVIPTSRLILQTDGKVVSYDSGVHVHSTSGRLGLGQQGAPCESIRSPNLSAVELRAQIY